MRWMVFGVTVLVMACSDHDPTGPERVTPVASVTIEPVTALHGVGSTHLVKVLLQDGSGRVLTKRTITFTSSDVRVLSVDASGMVRALAEGEATLTATSEGRSGQTRIRVLPAEDCVACWDYSPAP